MKIQYLGTAAAEGWPGIFCRCPACREATRRGGRNLRTRSQSIIDDQLLLDFPPDTYMHMLQHGVDLPSITACLITHTHQDHLYWLDLTMRTAGFANPKYMTEKPLTLYGNDDMTQLLDDIAAKHDPRVAEGVLDYRYLQPHQTTEIEGYAVTPLNANHFPGHGAYNYIIEKDGKRLLYAHDTGPFLEETWSYLRGTRFDLISLDCTMLAKDIRTTHMGINACCDTRARLLEEGCADDRTLFVINHFSHNGAFCPDGSLLLHEELVALMEKKGVLVTYDGMSLVF